MVMFKGLVSRKVRSVRRTNRFRYADHSASQSRLVARSSRFEHLEDRRMLAMVTVDPGDYLQVYGIDGGPQAGGIRTFDLSAGSHALHLTFATIPFSVDSNGDVSSGNPAAAEGDSNTLRRAAGENLPAAGR
jgi:hypothetical protein